MLYVYSSVDKLDCDACLSPEAMNWIDLNCSLEQIDGVWSGHKIEGSAAKSENEHMAASRLKGKLQSIWGPKQHHKV